MITHSDKSKKYPVIGGVVIAVILVALVLIVRKPVNESIANDSSTGEQSVIAAETEGQSLDLNEVVNPDALPIGDQKQKTTNHTVPDESTEIEKQVEQRIVAIVDLSENVTDTTDPVSEHPENDAPAEKKIEAEFAIADLAEDFEEFDPVNEEIYSKSQESANTQNEKQMSETQNESAQTESAPEASQGTEGKPETQESKESGEQEVQSPTQPSTEVSGESVTEPSVEAGSNPPIENSTDSAAESIPTPPVRELKKLVLEAESIVVPLSAPESLQAFDNLSGESKYELSMEFDSVTDYNNYIAFLKKAADKLRKPVGEDAEID